MTDALCGPSNALQSFQKHTSVDRTLQQDRLTGPRHSPAQGFRSFDPRAGSLDAEFHAFENASTNPFQLEQPAWQHNAQPAFQAQPASSWANDFQSLRISNSPIPAHQFRTEAPLVKTATGGWQQEFMRQRQNMSPAAAQKQPEYAAQFSNQGFTPYSGQPSYMPQQPGMYAQQNPAQQINVSEPQFSEAGFDQAFQDAFDHMQASEAQVATADPMQETVIEPQEDIAIHEPSNAKIGSDAIEYTETKERTQEQDTRDANDLARVAGELVHNVQHETNEKFRNSQFLDLMKRIRDREVEVRNNDFENTQGLQQSSQSQLEQSRPDGSSSFQFPNMNDVYVLDGTTDMTVDEDFHYNERPQTQISDLHPGGPFYPEQSPPQPSYAQMSGAVDSSVAADDANSRYATA
ncbi:hypothetical protein PMZ80_004328 [Knufia obscura]|uniref:Peroxin 20 n=1 Tax=Knufia obscura TaxID=1635080 RepID=A0ABR0RRS9_9EURO|nr:hypothetical protein PMZ80_004328 [Knufia obscura]